MKNILILAGLLMAGQAHAQDYYVKQSDRPHTPYFTVSGGINVQYWNNPDAQLKNVVRPKPQIGISYRLQLLKNLSIDPEVIVRANAMTIHIAQGSFIAGRMQPYSTVGEYSGFSGQIGVPLTIRYKWFGIGAGVFFERPLSMAYQLTYYSSASPDRTTTRRDISNLIGAGCQASVEINCKRYQIRAMVSQRNKLIALRNSVLPNSTITAVTMGYKF